MRIALVGLQASGKTTVFNALTGQQAETSAYGGKITANQAIVKVPDERLEKMRAMHNPKKFTQATVEYVDLAGIPRTEGRAGEGLGDKQLAEIATADALLAVVRGFEDVAGAAPEIEGDIETMGLEMALSDLRKIENRLANMDKQMRKAQGKEKDQLEIEKQACEAVRGALEEGRPAHGVDLDEDQAKALRGFQLLTIKPTLYLVNEGEAQFSERGGAPLASEAAAAQGASIEPLCGQMEMEIAQLDEADRAEFMNDYGITEPAARRVIRLCYEMLGQISFFTVGPDECRAWTIPAGRHAQQAAGAIHSDLERGFIRAEVIEWDTLLACGSEAEAKKQGKLRLEGKTYTVRDGDVMHILFNV